MIEGQWTLTGDGVSGWVKDNENPRPLWLELLADEEVIGIACANLPEPRNCGFWLPVPQAVLEEGVALNVRVANTNILIEASHAKVAEQEQTRPLAGELYVDRGLSVSGWALDPFRTDQKLRVVASIGDKIVAETVAAERRYRPAEADGHGFSLEFPSTFADGESHTVNIRDEKGRELPGSPFRIRCLPKNAHAWLENQKKIDKPLVEMLAGLLESMEERLPGFTSQNRFPSWKKAFPVPQPSARIKFSLELKAGAISIKNQQGCDIRQKSGDSELILIPGNASELHSFALAHMAQALRKHQADIIYSDGEDSDGQPLLRPAWDSEAFLCNDYLGPILATRSAWQAARIQPEDSPAAARARLLLAAPESKILHLPMPLSIEQCRIAQAEREAAINEMIKQGRVENGRVLYDFECKPRVSIIIPTRDHGDLLKICLDSLKNTDWPDYEIIIVDNGSVEEDALSVLRKAEEKSNVCVLRRPGIFNYAELNNSVARQATGEYLCFLNNDTQALHPQWLLELLGPLARNGDKAGACGAKLLWPNGLVQHGGVIVGTHQLAAHVGNRWLDDEPGYMGRNQYGQQYSAVTAACMVTPAKLFLESGGFDVGRFPIAFNDVDYCLRLRAQGRKVFWTPHSRLTHHESASRGKDMSASSKARADREMNMFRAAWGHYEDPFYNPNLTLSAATEPFFGLAFPPRPRQAR